MRIMIKGGVWKNTEDEILKAAVMKYGKNQWARISSLLVRKSAKQCKARWYEWLDPSIKKTEWTREEDEKLLHLAKLMPTQWRTIAPIVGRTPSQCLERYEKLLDAVCSKDENYEPSDDPRKLRPGEIDPNPESKPARPDPVDMDEDEKEMLSEARARLANTRGKKAKRKAREKQLEEARRLASLQKRRELKAAGIDTRKRKRKRKGIDYNAEIPFEKRPPPGFYDVVDEDRPVEQPSFPTTIEELEGKRRVDIEAQLRKQDIARNKIAQRQDAPSAILQANKLNDPEAVRKRSKLMLPAPQISDHELEEIAKMGYASDLVLGSDELAEGSGATRALLANYSQTPRQGMTPLRTPQRTPAGKADAIMMEAQNLARLRESQTPLLGGENPELHPSDFSGVTPRKREIQTPNLIGTPLASPGPMGLTPRIGMTPTREGYSFGVTPKGTPFRDELHINEDIEMRDSAKLELQRQTELKRNLRSGLTNLPQPKNEYQIVVQPIPEENEEDEEKIEDDMSDRIAREKAQEQARQEALLRKRSKVLQRELPRPPAASLELIRNLLTRVGEDKSSFVPPTLFEQADEMINKEMLALLEHDNAKYPLEGKLEKDKKKGKHVTNGKSSGSVPEIEDFEEDELKEADSLIKDEIQFLRVAMGHENESLDEFVKARDTCQEDLMYFPGRNTYGLASVAGNSEKLVALQNEFEIVKKRMDDEAKKATKLEQKIKVLTHGYQTRAGKLWSQIEATYKQMNTSATELECFQALQKQEVLAASSRISSSVEEVNKQKMLEESMQYRYGDLLTEYERIHRLLEEHRVQLQIQEEIAAKNRALEEEIAAKNRADEEAKNRAIEEEIAAKNRAIEEEIAAKDRALEEEIAAKNRADEEAKNRAIEEEIAAKDRAMEEEIAAKNRAVEDEIAANDRAVEDDKNHDIEEEATTKSCAPTEEIKAQDGTPDEGLGDQNHDQSMTETDGICVPDSSLHQTDGFLEESMPSVTSSVKESNVAEVMMVQAGTPNERLGDENPVQSMMEIDGACVSRSCLNQTDGILEEPMSSVEERVVTVETDDTCVSDSCLNQTDGSLEEPRPSEDIETPSVKEDTSERPAAQESGMVPEVSGDVKEHIIGASSAIMENIASSGSIVDDGMIENCSVEAAVVGTGNADAQSDEHAGDFSSQMIPPVPVDSEETMLPDLSNQTLVDSSSCIAVVSETVLETNTVYAGVLISEAVEKVDVTVETEAADETKVDAGEVSTTEADLTIQKG